MPMDVITLLVTLYFCGVGMCAETVYTSAGDFATSGNSSEYTLSAVSVVDCARQCNADAKCATFWYDTVSQLCHMSEHVLNGPTFGPYMDCPIGYQTFVRGKNALCLKHYASRMNHIDATATCGNDGGRLILIQDDSMLQFVGNIVDERGWAAVWVNGYDVDDDGNYETSEGNPLPYVPHGSILREFAGHLCIRLVGPPYKFNDLRCDIHTRYVLCEIVG